MKRLGKNNGKYFGETIDIDAVFERIERAASEHDWEIESFLDNPKLVGLIREVRDARKRVYISTGIHGDEPAGPLAVAELLEENQWPDDVSLWICPCLNPPGFKANSRENPHGIDLNRRYRKPDMPETMAHIHWLEQQSDFDLSLCLHEDWEAGGFYTYELLKTDGKRYAESVIEAVSKVCPIAESEEIEGRAASMGIIRAEFDPEILPEWPEAFYLVNHKTPVNLTFEAPSDYELPIRVAALKTAVHAALNSF